MVIPSSRLLYMTLYLAKTVKQPHVFLHQVDGGVQCDVGRSGERSLFSTTIAGGHPGAHNPRSYAVPSDLYSSLNLPEDSEIEIIQEGMTIKIETPARSISRQSNISQKAIPNPVDLRFAATKEEDEYHLLQLPLAEVHQLLDRLPVLKNDNQIYNQIFLFSADGAALAAVLSNGSILLLAGVEPSGKTTIAGDQLAAGVDDRALNEVGRFLKPFVKNNPETPVFVGIGAGGVTMSATIQGVVDFRVYLEAVDEDVFPFSRLQKAANRFLPDHGFAPAFEFKLGKEDQKAIAQMFGKQPCQLRVDNQDIVLVGVETTDRYLLHRMAGDDHADTSYRAHVDGNLFRTILQTLFKGAKKNDLVTVSAVDRTKIGDLLLRRGDMTIYLMGMVLVNM